MTSLEDRLRIAEIEVSRLKDLIAAQEPYPVGAVLMRRSYTKGSFLLAYRVQSIHESAAVSQRPHSRTPIWVTVWEDFSGGSFPSFGELDAAFVNRPGDWQELHIPGKE